MRFSGAMIFVADLDRMARFYGDILGLTPIADTRTADWIAFQADGASFALHAIPAQAAEATGITAPPAPRDQAPCKLFLAVDDVQREVRRLAGLGVTTIQRPWGDWDMVDPEGNVLGLRPAG